MSQKRFPIVTVKNYYVGISRAAMDRTPASTAAEADVHAEAENSADTSALTGASRQVSTPEIPRIWLSLGDMTVVSDGSIVHGDEPMVYPTS